MNKVIIFLLSAFQQDKTSRRSFIPANPKDFVGWAAYNAVIHRDTINQNTVKLVEMYSKMPGYEIVFFNDVGNCGTKALNLWLETQLGFPLNSMVNLFNPKVGASKSTVWHLFDCKVPPKELVARSPIFPASVMGKMQNREQVHKLIIDLSIAGRETEMIVAGTCDKDKDINLRHDRPLVTTQIYMPTFANDIAMMKKIMRLQILEGARKTEPVKVEGKEDGSN